MEQLGNHGGLDPIRDKEKAAGIMLRVLGRMQAGKDVPARQALIRRALDGVAENDRYWLETLASKLTEDGGVEAVPAHLAALALAWEFEEEEVARLVRNVNATQGSDEFVGRAVKGMLSAAPEFKKRFLEKKINSDEVFVRTALAHLFRRDPESVFQMFVIDGVVRAMGKAMRHDAQSFSKACLEKFSDSDVPDNAWGYVVVLRELSSRAGYFIPAPTAEMREQSRKVRQTLEKELGPLTDEAFVNNVAATLVGGMYQGVPAAMLVPLMGPALEPLGMKCVVLYAREGDDGRGFYTNIIKMPTEDPKEARRIASNLPEVRMHDDFRRMQEFLAQARDNRSKAN